MSKRSLEILKEGINDTVTHKVIFMAGGSGAGKDFAMKKALGGLVPWVSASLIR